ncbi:MAG: hypothetical protein COC19_02085 [SAR86 cluster bacterium]|uniref:Uncharacterized protein n=1 Tax=SAR86 cluster bacterium TaxID=2030880 RepID=A0A2A4MSY9_9GAMM|nr:MAG: hypothetical protein COC19_02085 [SAR86 cluster bacterium]
MIDKEDHEDSTVDEKFRVPLKSIARAKHGLIVCFFTLPIYIVAVYVLLSRGLSVSVFMTVYMVLYTVFGLNMAIRRCPKCRQQFFVKSILLNLVTKKCVHCGLAYDVQNKSRKF